MIGLGTLYSRTQYPRGFAERIAGQLTHRDEDGRTYTAEPHGPQAAYAIIRVRDESGITLGWL